MLAQIKRIKTIGVHVPFPRPMEMLQPAARRMAKKSAIRLSQPVVRRRVEKLAVLIRNERSGKLRQGDLGRPQASSRSCTSGHMSCSVPVSGKQLVGQSISSDERFLDHLLGLSFTAICVAAPLLLGNSRSGTFTAVVETDRQFSVQAKRSSVDPADINSNVAISLRHRRERTQMEIDTKQLWDQYVFGNPVTVLLRFRRQVGEGEIDSITEGFERIAADVLKSMQDDPKSWELGQNATLSDIAATLQDFAEIVFDGCQLGN